jgi:hypothetical protein
VNLSSGAPCSFAVQVVEICPKCGGCMRWVEVAKTEAAAHRLMVQLGYAPQPPPRPHHTPLGQLGLPFDD